MTDRDQRFSESATPTQPDAPVNNQDSKPVPHEKILNRVQRKLSKLHLFAAFCERPTNVTFETQESDELILIFLRKSQWVNFPWIVTAIALSVIPIILYFLSGTFTAFIPPLKVLLITVPFYYLLISIYVFVNFATWYYNAAIITNKRIIDIDFHQIVFKDVAETKLALVQDVSYKQDGVLPNLLGYGFVLIQTAGSLENFEFYNLPHPARIVEIVEDLIGGKRFYEP